MEFCARYAPSARRLIISQRMESWSVEDWLISPMITNNKELWVIQIIVPIRE